MQGPDPITSNGAPAAASTESTAQSGLLTLINQARTQLGLKAFRSDSKLGALAVNRARFMVNTGDLSHTTYGGEIGPAVSSTGIKSLSVGEDVATAGYATGSSTASVLFNLWKNSPPHWANITDNKFNYIGIGVALIGYPYLVTGTLATWAIGLALLALAYRQRAA